MKKAHRQKTMAAALRVTPRRLRDLEDLGVVVRDANGTYDVAKNVNRYETYRRRDTGDIENLYDEVLSAAQDAERLIPRVDPDKPSFRKAAQSAAQALHRLDEGMKLLNAMRPASEQNLLDDFRRLIVDQEFRNLLGRLRIATEEV